MRQLYVLFPNRHSLSSKLTWTHYRNIIRVSDQTARNFYVEECASQNWSVRQLQRQINTLYYERLLSSRDKDVVRYTLPEDESQIFAAKYMTYLPTKEQLRRLLEI